MKINVLGEFCCNRTKNNGAELKGSELSHIALGPVTTGLCPLQKCL